MKANILKTSLGVVLLVFVYACSPESVTSDAQGADAVIVNAAEYSQVMNARMNMPTPLSAAFEILTVERVGSMLKIELTGGCEVSNYKVIWDGKVMESHPEQINLVVVYENTSNDECIAVTHNLVVNLSALLGLDAGGMMVNLYNGSKVRGFVVDENGIVATN
jgi:hypothetical protein